MVSLKIAVLMGGPSFEHNVSLESGKQILDQLKISGHNVLPVFISRDAQWMIDGKIYSEHDGVKELLAIGAQLVFIALHGSYGEDGTVQKLLDTHGMRYTGSSAEASARAMDKSIATQFFRDAGLNVPKTIIAENQKRVHEIFPCIIKPARSGSSFGVSLVRKKEEFDGAFQRAQAIDKKVLIQEYIEGREVTCAVLEKDQELIALPPTLIMTEKDFFDFDAKYHGESKELTPAPLSDTMIQAIKQTAIAAHKALSCTGLTRTDMILDENDLVFVLEINTIPGMTAASLVPQQARAAGMTDMELIQIIIDCALPAKGLEV